MKKTKVLLVFSEMSPFTEEPNTGNICRELPQIIQERGKEIRTFMPRYGIINERKNQLHEIIRLSGMNMIIADNDYSLIVKQASIQSARMAVYFIDNEEYFKRKALFSNAKGKPFEDNLERAFFYCKSIFNTVEKLGWAPDIIHAFGPMSAFMPYLLLSEYRYNSNLFSNTKIFYTPTHDDGYVNNYFNLIPNKLNDLGLNKLDNSTFKNLNDIGIIYSHEIIKLPVLFDAKTISNFLESINANYEELLLTEFKSENLIRIVVDADTTQKDEIISFLTELSKFYRNIGGDGLVILENGVLEPDFDNIII